MTPAEQSRWIGDKARASGFDLCGVAPIARENCASADRPEAASPGPFPELDHLPEWLARGYAGEMSYLHDPRRADPRLVLEGARSLIVVALNYNSPPRPTALPENADPDSPRGWISRYAWGDDYHELMQQKLRALISEMRAEFAEPFEARAYTDTGPIIERVAAKYAGIGWLAKNTCLINSRLGSWLFLGVIVTTLSLEPTLAPGEPPSRRHVRNVHALPGCVPHAGVPGAICPRRAPLHLLSHDRASRRNSGRAASPDGPRRNRLRYLPGRVPLESQSAGHVHGRISTADRA